MFAKPEEIIKGLNLKPGQTVADLGSGVGFYSLAAAEQVAPNGLVYAIDIQTDLLLKIKQEARERGLEHLIELFQGDLEVAGDTKLKDQAVQAVIMANVLFQLEKKSEAVREMARILQTGGVGLLMDWSDSFGGLGPQPERVLTNEHSRQLLTEAGLKIEGEFEAGSHHYGLLFQKVD